MKLFARSLLVLILAWAGAMPAFADSSAYSDMPLRTLNRAKPNILFLVDNGVSSQYTFSTDNFVSSMVGAFFTTSLPYQLVNSHFFASGGFGATAYSPPFDNDWHYRASGYYANATTGSCANTGVCTLAGAANSCPSRGSACFNVFNRLYYNPATSYGRPRDASGTIIALPAELASLPSSCVCSDKNYCAWLDGHNTSAGCVDLKGNFTTAPYPPTPGQLWPWSALSPSGATAPSGSAYAPVFEGIVQANGQLSPSANSSGNYTYPASLNTASIAKAAVAVPGISAEGSSNSVKVCWGSARIPPLPASLFCSTAAYANAYNYSPGSFSYGTSCTVGTDCPAHPDQVSSYYPPTCTGGAWTTGPSCSDGVSTAGSCPTGRIVTGTYSTAALWCNMGPTSTASPPSSWSSPAYCDTKTVSDTYSTSTITTNGLNVCLLVTSTMATANPARKVWANSGPADFFDPDGTRHVITDGSDTHFSTAANRTNFAVWHSFYRTRLLTLKTSMNLAMQTANLNSNYRVGLAAMAAGDSTQGSLGASTDPASNYFSAIAEFSNALSPPHITEWYTQLAKIQPITSAGQQTDFPDALHRTYLWFTGNLPDPSLPATGFMTQSAANTTQNTGADSQYIYATDANGNLQTTAQGQTVATNRTGPLMYSCQVNALTVVATTPYTGVQTPVLANLQTSSGACTDPYPTAYATGAPCELSSAKVSLPSYVTSFTDPLAYRSGTAGVTISASDTSWPYPFKAPTASYYPCVTCDVADLVNKQQTSMADLALYYWSHDLNEEFNKRSSSQVQVVVPKPDGSGKLGVPPYASDQAYWPHVTTSAVSLAMSGQYDYSLASTLTALQAGTSAWPTPSVVPQPATFNSSGQVTSARSPYGGNYYTSVDDLAHAAVNGHGHLVSAYDQTTLGSALGSIFVDVLKLSGSESAVAVANTQVSQSGVSFAFQSSYKTSGWVGDLVASQILASTGIINSYSFDAVTCRSPASGANAGWSAQCGLRELLCPGYLAAADGTYTCSGNPPGAASTTSNRNIVTDSGSVVTVTGGAVTHPGMAFTSGNLPGITSTVIDYLRGDSTYETCTAGATTCYRSRLQGSGSTIGYWNPMGDVVDAEAVVVGGVVFQGANDGMVHAFYVGDGTVSQQTCAATSTTLCPGQELWAYVPSLVIPNLPNLASTGYTHQYFVNATPTFGPVTFTSDNAQHTLLVGGLGKGGRGYYALDVTHPILTTSNKQAEAASKVLWTFPTASATCPTPSGGTSTPVTDMGYSYGRPALVQVNNQWAVLLTSGYDNGNSTGGNGYGHLYVLDPETGACLVDVSTGVGSGAAPSGLAYIAARVTNPGSNQTLAAVYGGDLLGNVWKFIPPASGITDWTSTKFAVLKDPTNKSQPVTSEPNIAVINNTAMIFIGTGKYLGTNDVPANANYKSLSTYVGQSMYALTDYASTDTNYLNYASTSARAVIPAASSINGDCSNSSGGATTACDFGSQYCAVQSNLTRCFTPAKQASLSSTSGTAAHPWMLDLPAGEEVVTSPLLVLGSLLFTSNQPVSDPCQPGGRSYLYMLNYANGAANTGSGFVSQAILDPSTHDNVMASRPTVVQLADGRIVVIISTSAGGVPVQNTNAFGQPPRRMSWREIAN